MLVFVGNDFSELCLYVKLGKISWNSEVLVEKSLHQQSFEEFAVKIFGV